MHGPSLGLIKHVYNYKYIRRMELVENISHIPNSNHPVLKLVLSKAGTTLNFTQITRGIKPARVRSGGARGLSPQFNPWATQFQRNVSGGNILSDLTDL